MLYSEYPLVERSLACASGRPESQSGLNHISICWRKLPTIDNTLDSSCEIPSRREGMESWTKGFSIVIECWVVKTEGLQQSHAAFSSMGQLPTHGFLAVVRFLLKSSRHSIEYGTVCVGHLLPWYINRMDWTLIQAKTVPWHPFDWSIPLLQSIPCQSCFSQSSQEWYIRLSSSSNGLGQLEAHPGEQERMPQQRKKSCLFKDVTLRYWFHKIWNADWLAEWLGRRTCTVQAGWPLKKHAFNGVVVEHCPRILPIGMLKICPRYNFQGILHPWALVEIFIVGSCFWLCWGYFVPGQWLHLVEVW